jgi:hypothetical protein
MFLFSTVWMQPFHFSFLYGLNATSPFFCLDGLDETSSFFLFSIFWMQPVHFNLVVWCRVKPSKALRNARRMREWKAEYAKRTRPLLQDTCTHQEEEARDASPPPPQLPRLIQPRQIALSSRNSGTQLLWQSVARGCWRTKGLIPAIKSASGARSTLAQEG